tara:strand:- start:752 stop:910 length:159 start_codon:yes stop_codon:yes gene_type:complete
MIRYDEPYKIHVSIDDHYHSDITYDDIFAEDNMIRMPFSLKESELASLFGIN